MGYEREEIEDEEQGVKSNLEHVRREAGQNPGGSGPLWQGATLAQTPGPQSRSFQARAGSD